MKGELPWAVHIGFFSFSAYWLSRNSDEGMTDEYFSIWWRRKRFLYLFFFLPTSLVSPYLLVSVENCLQKRDEILFGIFSFSDCFIASSLCLMLLMVDSTRHRA